MDLTDNKPKTSSILLSKNTVTNSLPQITNSNIDDSFTTTESNNSSSIFEYVIKIIRIILIIYLVSYVVLTILNQLDLLPDWLADIFSPIDIIGKIFNKNKKKEDQDTSSLATSIKKDSKPRPEKIAPSQFVPEDNSGILTSEPKPDNASSSTQSSKIANKAGYCYIGEDRGFRSCIKIKDGDKCMSGNIFPTEAICINPNLRP